MFRLTEIEGEDPEKFQNLPVFEELMVVNPNKRIKLETVPERYTASRATSPSKPSSACSSLSANTQSTPNC